MHAASIPMGVPMIKHIDCSLKKLKSKKVLEDWKSCRDNIIKAQTAQRTEVLI